MTGARCLAAPQATWPGAAAQGAGDARRQHGVVSESAHAGRGQAPHHACSCAQSALHRSQLGKAREGCRPCIACQDSTRAPCEPCSGKSSCLGVAAESRDATGLRASDLLQEAGLLLPAFATDRAQGAGLKRPVCSACAASEAEYR